MRIRNLLVAPIMVSAFLLSGCATIGDRAPPLTIDGLVERARLGESAESLLALLRVSRERFALSGSEYALLKERGLPAAVLDELQKRELQAARDDQWRNSRFYWDPWGRPLFPFGHDYRYIYVPAPPIPMPKPR